MGIYIDYRYRYMSSQNDSDIISYILFLLQIQIITGNSYLSSPGGNLLFVRHSSTLNNFLVMWNN